MAGVAAQHQVTQPGGSGGLSGFMYWPLGHGTDLRSGTYERQVQTWWRTVGTFSNLGVYINTNTDTDITRIRTIFNASLSGALGSSGINGAILIIVPAATTGYFEEDTVTDPMPSGQSRYCSLKRERLGAVTINGFLATQVAFEFTSDTDGERVYRLSMQGDTNAHGDYYYFAGCMGMWPSGIEQGWTSGMELGQQLYAGPSGGTLRNACFKAWASTLNTTVEFTIRKNGADTPLVVSVPSATSGRFEDITNQVTLVEGDLFCWKADFTGRTAGSYTHETLNVDLVTDDWFGGGSRNGSGIVLNLNDNAICTPNGNHQTTADPETEIQWRAKTAEEWRGIVVMVPTNLMENGNAYWRPRINGVNGTQTVTVPFGQTGVFISAGVTADPFEIGDLLSIDRTLVSTSTPALTYHTHSFFGGPVVESDPSASDPSASDPSASDPSTPEELPECVAAPPTVECIDSGVARAGCVAAHTPTEAGCAQPFDSTTLTVRLNG